MKLKIYTTYLLWGLFAQNLYAQTTTSPKLMPGSIERGIISYYTEAYNVRTTASGEKYDKNDLVACHKKLPFNSKVKITNLGNNKSVIVRINDRGPFAYGRIMDVSEAAAKRIDLISSGTAKVEMEIISLGATAQITAKTEENPQEKPEKEEKIVTAKNPPFALGNTYTQAGLPIDPVGYAVQVGTFAELEKAKTYCKQLKDKGFVEKVFIWVTENTTKQKVFKLLMGAFEEKTAAEVLKLKLKSQLGKDTFIRLHER